MPGWEIQVLELVRGEAAWQRIQAANQFNDPPREGYEYLLLRIHARCTAEDEEAHSINPSSFRVAGSRRIKYRVPVVVKPEPALDADLYAGGETEGWIAMHVGEQEDDLILIFRDRVVLEEAYTRYIALEPGASLPVPEGLSEISAGTGGTRRGDPVPLGETVTTENWEITALEYVRGDEAWARLQAANEFNEPALAGMEYVLVRVHARYIGTENKAVNKAANIDGASFKSTGEDNVLYLIPSVVEPEPDLDVDLLPGGEYAGWVTVLAGQGETDLELVFEPWLSFDDEELRFIALEEGASPQVPEGLAEIEPTDLGVERAEPAPLGETVTTENWEITLLEAVRGEEAWTWLQAVNQYNDPPATGLEYVVARVRARYIGTEDEAASISGSSFRSTGDAGIVYDNPVVVEPAPVLDAYLFPGGTYEGWITVQAEQGETGLMLIFEPWLSFSDEEQRFLALD
jgi:hypothetical protein